MEGEALGKQEWLDPEFYEEIFWSPSTNFGKPSEKVKYMQLFVMERQYQESNRNFETKTVALWKDMHSVTKNNPTPNDIARNLGEG